MTMTEDSTRSDGNFVVKPYANTPTLHACNEEGCDRTFESAQGLSMHKSRSHGAPSQRSTRARSAGDADEMFDRCGAAIDVLFPEGIPASRIIELADLMKLMLRVIR
jgi:hypothetical protein